MKKSRKYTLITFGYCLALMLCWGCSTDLPDASDNPDVPIDDDSEVVVTFSTGNGAAHTRTCFSEGTPVKIFIYQHQSGGVNLAGVPYKTVEGKTEGVGDSNSQLSSVVLTGGDLSNGNYLTVRSGKTYEFIVVVSATTGAKLTDIGFPASGIITGFTHGSDILAGREQVTVAYGTKNLAVTFKSNGADSQGNLPHLGSAVCIQGRVTEKLLKELNTGSVSFAIAGMDFKQCLPKSANLSFTGSSPALIVQGVGFNTSYSANVLTTPVNIDNTESVTSANGYLLPYPLQNTLGYNVLNIDFRLRVNGGEVVFQAPGLQTPSFDPGYRYKFIIELDYEAPEKEGVVNLYLSIEPWSSLSWQSGMGESDETDNLMLLSLGSWSSVTWHSGMGAEDTSDKIITSVSGWKSATWISQMGA